MATPHRKFPEVSGSRRMLKYEITDLDSANLLVRWSFGGGEVEVEALPGSGKPPIIRNLTACRIDGIPRRIRFFISARLTGGFLPHRMGGGYAKHSVGKRRRASRRLNGRRVVIRSQNTTLTGENGIAKYETRGARKGNRRPTGCPGIADDA